MAYHSSPNNIRTGVFLASWEVVRVVSFFRVSAEALIWMMLKRGVLGCKSMFDDVDMPYGMFTRRSFASLLLTLNTSRLGSTRKKEVRATFTLVGFRKRKPHHYPTSEPDYS